MRIFLIFNIFSFLFFKNVLPLDFKDLVTKKGVNFWFVEDNSIPIISVSFSFKGGAYLDPIGKEGVSNLMTSLFDEGVEGMTGSEFQQSIKESGMKLYFSTGKEKIDGTFQIVSSNKDIGFELFHKALNLATFPTEEIEKVKNQVKASIKIDESDIPTLASKKFNESFFGDHKFSNNEKGSMESLKKIKRKDIISYKKKNLLRSNLIIGVSGNIREDEIKYFIDHVFGDLPDDEINFDVPKFNDLPRGEKIWEVETPQTAVIFGHRGLKRKDKNFFAARIINYVRGGGRVQSRLYKKIRKKEGLVYSIYSYLSSYHSDGLILGGFQTQNQYVYKTINLVKEEWDQIGELGLQKTEFEEAKTYFKGSFARNFTSTLSIANLLRIVQYYDLGKNYFNMRNKIIDQVEFGYANKLSKKLFNSDNLFFLIVGKPE